MQKAPGKLLILIPGIIYFLISLYGVVNALVVIFGSALFFGAGAAAQAATNTTELIAGGVATLVFSLVLLGLVVVQLIFGIVGIKNCGKPAKARSVRKVGVAIIVLAVVSLAASIGINVFSDTYGAPTTIFTVSMLYNQLLPIVIGVFYIVGANMNARSLPPQ